MSLLLLFNQGAVASGTFPVWRLIARYQTMAERIPQSTAIRVPLEAWLATDHATPATGKTIPITISKNGGAYANPSAGATNATEIGNGSYYVDLSTTDTATLGPLKVRGVEGTIDVIKIDYDVVNDSVPQIIPMELGDYTTTQHGYLYFLSTVDGVPTSLAGSPAVKLVTFGSASPSVAIVLTTNMGGITGLNYVTIDLTHPDLSGFGDWSVILSAATLGGKNIAGTLLGSFSQQNRSLNGSSISNAIFGYPTASITPIYGAGTFGPDVVAALLDALPEPTGAPPASATLATKLSFIFEALRNKNTVDATSMKFFDDAGVLQWQKALSDDGTTYTEDEGA